MTDKNDNNSPNVKGFPESNADSVIIQADSVTERVTKKVIISTDDIQRMKRLVSLFGDEIGDSPKEIDVLSFFFEKSFSAFLNSGIIENKIASIKGN